VVKDFRTSGYFSMPFLIVGIALFPIGVVAASQSFIAAGVLFLVAILILTTHYRLRLDFNSKTYHDYLWILGMKHGEKGKFDKAEYLFLKATKISQSMNSRVSSSTISKHVIDAYLRLTPENKIHLFTKDSKHDVIVRLRELSVELNLKVVDYTLEEPSHIV
jgi:hypothetical protein